MWCKLQREPKKTVEKKLHLIVTINPQTDQKGTRSEQNYPSHKKQRYTIACMIYKVLGITIANSTIPIKNIHA